MNLACPSCACRLPPTSNFMKPSSQITTASLRQYSGSNAAVKTYYLSNLRAARSWPINRNNTSTLHPRAVGTHVLFASIVRASTREFTVCCSIPRWLGQPSMQTNMYCRFMCQNSALMHAELLCWTQMLAWLQWPCQRPGHLKTMYLTCAPTAGLQLQRSSSAAAGSPPHRRQALTWNSLA